MRNHLMFPKNASRPWHREIEFQHELSDSDYEIAFSCVHGQILRPKFRFITMYTMKRKIIGSEKKFLSHSKQEASELL